MEIDPTCEDGMYRTMTSLLVPRPIGWISTRSTDGVENIAPYSFFNGINESNPPVVMFSSEQLPDGRHKDSVENAIETGEFVHNLVTMDFLAQMDYTSEPIDTKRSEFDIADLETEDAVTVSAPRVAGGKAHLECTLYDHFTVGDHAVVLGEVQHIHVDDDLLTDEQKVDVRKVGAVGRLTGEFYARLDPVRVERRDGLPRTSTDVTDPN
jgi:flavin reductase (DIM6/NTAB) family NADH-FMN oxidoreductase RutF